MSKKSSAPMPKGNQHWEMRYDTNQPSRNMEATEGSDFAPKPAKDRKTTYVKVNETDH